MFSRNQIWRIQRNNSNENLSLVNSISEEDNEEKNENLLNGNSSGSGSGNIGMNGMSGINERNGTNNNSSSTTTTTTIRPKRNISSDAIASITSILPLNECKKVRFNETCRVVLIPCLKEYRSLGLHLDMWWQEKDYRSFKLSATQEISNFLSSFGGDVKSITRYLYQPDSVKMSLIGMEN